VQSYVNQLRFDRAIKPISSQQISEFYAE